MPERNYQHNDCLNSGATDTRRAEGAGSRSSFFPRLDSDNVNAVGSKAGELLAVWDFLEHKRRVGMTQVLFNRKDNRGAILIIGAQRRSRYFEEGKLYSAWKIEKRLGRFNRVLGLMETVTYDPKTISQREAWALFGKDTRRFLNAVNQYRRRRGWRRLHCLWVVEVQPGTGYPHPKEAMH